MGEHVTEKTTTVEKTEPTVPVERVVEETTVSVPEHEVTREEHRVTGTPENAVTETVTTTEEVT